MLFVIAAITGRWDPVLAMLLGLLLGLVIVIPIRKLYWRAAPRVFPELSDYTDCKIRKRALFRAMNNWRTAVVTVVFVSPICYITAMFIPGWYVRSRAPAGSGTSALTEWLRSFLALGLPLVVLFGTCCVLVPLLTRNAIREKLRHQLSRRHNEEV